jgi:amidohydrolase
LSNLLHNVKALASALESEQIRRRHHLHANPELSFEEVNTAAFIAAELEAMGISFTSGIVGTGIVAEVKGNNPASKTIALRADMDALPILEENRASYASRNTGVMHACGHDVHTTSLLGAIQILNQVKGQFEGTVRCIFQPGEEKFPGGASLMIKAGALDNPRPAAILGQHVAPQIPAGKVGFRSGMYMASADEIYITVKGKGGHAAMPDKCIDPILIASHLIVALQQVISRNNDPRQPSVLSFGKITGLGATNVIPSEVKIEGTFRTLNEVWRAEAKKRIHALATGLVASMGGEAEVLIHDGYPFLKNEEQLTLAMRSAAVDYLGEDNVVDLDVWMAAEDFAYYSQIIDSCFYRLGTRNEAKGITSGVHTATFDIDETALPIGAGLMAWLAIQRLNQ